MSQYIESVEEFHTVFGAPVLPAPVPLVQTRWLFRHQLLAEELDEFWDACEAGDLVKAADALCDLQYVLSGAILELGLKDKFDQLFAEVHRANMSKACSSQAEADQTISHYRSQRIDVYSKVLGGKWVIYRSSDAKILKSINWSEPDFSTLIPQVI